MRENTKEFSVGVTDTHFHTHTNALIPAGQNTVMAAFYFRFVIKIFNKQFYYFLLRQLNG